MLRVLIWLGQLLLVGHAAYSSIISLWGLRTPAGSVAGEPHRRMRVVVAAHNEATVITGVASDLASQQYPSDLLRACVIADRCTDDTAEIARAFVEVAERSIGEGAKGAAISWYLDQEPLGDDEALLVLDADSRIGSDYLHGVAAALSGECEVVQTYLDVANPDGSVLSTANALTYWASNRMVQLSRSNIGWSCDLGGTGMAMSSRSLAQAGGFGDDLTDDLSLNIRLNLVGHRAKWLHNIRVYDEKPTDTRSTVVQRARWVRGKRDLQRRYGWPLVRSGVSRRQPALLDLAFRLYNPGRSFVAFVVAILALVAAAFPEVGLWPWWLLGGIAAIASLLPMLFLVIDRVPARYIVRYPYIALVAILWIPIRIGSRIVSSWRRTPHRG